MNVSNDKQTSTWLQEILNIKQQTVNKMQAITKQVIYSIYPDSGQNLLIWNISIIRIFNPMRMQFTLQGPVTKTI